MCCRCGARPCSNARSRAVRTATPSCSPPAAPAGEGRILDNRDAEDKVAGFPRGSRLAQGESLPVEELKSLIDASQTDPALPEGHPFSNIKSEIYWSATPSKSDDIVAWQVSFFTGEPVTDQKSGTRRIWCVLGGT